MKPSVQEMITSVQAALREKVAPQVDDPWAASTLRSVDVILEHLRARTPVEGPMLYQDNGDLLECFTAISEVEELNQPGIKQGLADFLGAAETLNNDDYPSVDQLNDLNLQGRKLVDDMLLLCMEQQDSGRLEHVHAVLRAYLDRHIERERDFYFPVFVGRPI